MPVDRAKRAIAYHAIDTERAYQEKRWGETRSGGRAGRGERSVDEFTAYLQGYMNMLVATVATSNDDNTKLEVMRKVAGLCVACFEQHGVPLRDGYKGEPGNMIGYLKASATRRAVEGYMCTAPMTRDEYEVLHEHGLLGSVMGEDGAPNIPTFQGLVVDRADAPR